MNSNQKIPQQEIDDWFENPITEQFFQTIDKAMQDVHESKKNAFAPGDPGTTHERHAWALGAEWAFAEVQGMKIEKRVGGFDEE